MAAAAFLALGAVTAAACGDRLPGPIAHGHGRPVEVTMALDPDHVVPVPQAAPVRPVPAPRVVVPARGLAPSNELTRTHNVGVATYGTALASYYDYGHRGGFAHRTMPKGTRVEFCLNGRCVVARCMGWGPAAYTGRDFDLDIEVFRSLAPISRGVIRVDWRIVP